MNVFYVCLVLYCCLCCLEAKSPSKSYQGRFTRDLKDYDVVIPRKVTQNGEFISHLLPHHYKRSLEEDINEMCADDRLHYLVPIEGEDHHLELRPNHDFMSPGMAIETRNRGAPNETLSGIHIRRMRNTQCHYKGVIRGHDDSRTALSTCYGLAGYIRSKRGLFLIEPVKDHDPESGEEHPHLIYRRHEDEEGTINCNLKGNITDSLAKRAVRERDQNTLKSKRANSARQTEFKAEHSTPLYMEALVVMDKSLVEYHKEFDVENYVLTVLNMAHDMFHDATFGILLNLVLVRLIRLEEEEDELNMAITSDAEKTLDFFCDWQSKLNPGDDSHPNHHDVAVLITRINICADDKNCGLLGLAKEAGCCEPKFQAAVAEDCGLKVGFVIAHELAHTLGVGHDTVDGSGCNGTIKGGSAYTVMNPAITMKIEEWSHCSQNYVRVFLEGGYGACLEDPPADHEFNLPDILPGVMYGSDYQCRTMLYPTAVECEMGITCDSLNCEVPGFGCMETHVPPAAGTRCGEKRWCYQRKCLMEGERPGAIDGGWGEWTSWSECSRTCGSGVAFMERQCDKPEPSHGGRFCIGERKRHKICSTEPCEIGQPSFRDVQCAEFNDWVYPEDLKTHRWKGFYMHDENPCALFCRDEEGVVASLKPKVIDGTTCYRGIRDICIGGVCREIPCDLDLESKAVEDVCGVCHGDGTQCRIKEGTKSFSFMPKGLRKLTDVPEGTRNIRVEEVEPTRAQIAVLAKGTNEFYIKGNTLGMFSVPGSKAWLGMVRGHQEALNIPGPVTAPLSIMVRPRENVTLHYSMALKVRHQRTPEFLWDYMDWSRCSAQCGPGIQVSVPRCMEKQAGLVEDVYCRDTDKPNAMTRPCDLGPCLARWMIGDWQDCKLCPPHNSCKRIRAVKCIKPVGEGEGEAQIISDSECIGPKPHEEEPCSHCRKTRVDDDYDQELPINFSPAVVVKDRSCKAKNTSQSKVIPKFHRGRTIMDKEDESEVHIKILMDKSHVSENGLPEGMPTPPENASSWVLEGKDALRFMQKLLEQSNVNKTKTDE